MEERKIMEWGKEVEGMEMGHRRWNSRSEEVVVMGGGAEIVVLEWR